jgi:outer membrane receptor protein involved in Fe transport
MRLFLISSMRIHPLSLLLGAAPILAQTPAPTATLPESVITAEAPAYLPETVQSGSKLDIPAKDQVQTVNTLTQQELKDRG